MKKKYDWVKILGLKIHKVTIDEAIEEVKHAVKNQTQLTIAALNPHKINLAFIHPSLKDKYKRFDLVTPDGIGTICASWVLGSPITTGRISGDILAPHFYQWAQEYNLRFYFLGASEGIAKQASERLIQAYPSLNIAGIHNGYFDHQSEKDEQIVQEINDLGVDIVFVGMSTPLQEEWIINNAPRLNCSVLVTMGGYFDLVTKRIDCYPRWVYRLKLNWLYRLLSEPRRLWRRYLLGTPVFFYRVIKQKVNQ